LYKAPEKQPQIPMAKRPASNQPPLPKRLVGYARVSTDDQVHDAQMDELRAAHLLRSIDRFVDLSGLAVPLAAFL